MIRTFILAVILFFSVSYAAQDAFAAKTLPQEVQEIGADVEPIAVLFLQIIIGTCFAVGMALCVPPKLRPYGYGLLTGVFSVVLVLMAFTDYMPSVSRPLTKILENKGNIAQLLKSGAE